MMAYKCFRSCGCLVEVDVDDPADSPAERRELAMALGKHIIKGGHVERVTVEEVRAAAGSLNPGIPHVCPEVSR